MNCRKCDKPLPDGALFCCWCAADQRTKNKTGKPKQRGNGQGCVYKLPNGKYRAVVVLGYYRGDDGKIHKKTKSKIFAKRSDGILAIQELKSTPFMETRKIYTVSDLYELFQNSKDYNAFSAGHQKKLGYAWNKLEPLHFRPINEITVYEMQAVIDDKAATYDPAKDMKAVMSHLYTLAMKKEIVTFNKTNLLDLPESPTAKRERWEDSEIQAFWNDYKTNPFTGYILIMIYAGLRYGEISTITLDNIHYDDYYMIGGIKTDAGINREIPIADEIMPIIKALAEGKRKKLLEMNEDTFYSEYWDVISRLSLRHLPPQTCRHTYFSLMTAAGIQAGIITETGGHASYLTTMKNYVRLSVEEKRSAVNQITPNNRKTPGGQSGGQ